MRMVGTPLCFLISALWTLIPSAGLAQDAAFTFELYRLDQGSRVAITQGTVVHSPRDPRQSVARGGRDDMLSRELRFTPGFAVGVSDRGEQAPRGFGAWLRRVPDSAPINRDWGFSWEWYDRGFGALYRKRQGEGTVSIETVPSGTRYALSRIVFREDTLFRLTVDEDPTADARTHELVIRAGSVLQFSTDSPP